MVNVNDLINKYNALATFKPEVTTGDISHKEIEFDYGKVDCFVFNDTEYCVFDKMDFVRHTENLFNDILIENVYSVLSDEFCGFFDGDAWEKYFINKRGKASLFGYTNEKTIEYKNKFYVIVY